MTYVIAALLIALIWQVSGLLSYLKAMEEKAALRFRTLNANLDVRRDLIPWGYSLKEGPQS